MTILENVPVKPMSLVTNASSVLLETLDSQPVMAAHVMLKDLSTITVMLPPDIVSVTPTLLETAVTNAPLEALTSQLVKNVLVVSKVL
jgi:hypothetical protein